MVRSFFDWLFRSDLGVDLGTAAIRVQANGAAAPLVAVAPGALAGGVVVEPSRAVESLGPLLARARGRFARAPRVVAGVPTDASEAERVLVEQVVRAAGARAVAVVPEPLAAAVGAGLDVGSPYAQLVVDVGHGVTDAAVLRAGQVVATRAVRVACGDLERAVAQAVERAVGVAPVDGELRRVVGRLSFDPEPHGDGAVRVEARDGAVEVDLAPLAAAAAPVHAAIVGVVVELLRDLPDATGAEVVESGATLTGGGALLPGLAAAVAHRTGLAVRVVGDPLTAVVRGAARMLPVVDRLAAWA